MTLLEVLSSLQSQGSGTGWSYYSERCAARAILDKAFPRTSSFDAQVGTVYHKLMELYYTRQLRSVALPLDDQADFEHDPVQEALRIFAGYTPHFPDDEWDVIGAEVLLPRNGDERVTLADHIVDPFTLRIDLVVRINEEQARKQEERCGVDVLPGLYLTDHKVKNKKDSNAAFRWAMNPQFTLYQYAWNLLHPTDPCRGLIVNQPIRHQDLTKIEGERPRSYQRYIVPYPSEMEIAACVAHVRHKKGELATGRHNLDACMDFEPCAHYVMGRCQRI